MFFTGMADDHSLRPVRSFLFFLGFQRRSPSPLSQLGSSDTRFPSASPHEPHRRASEHQIASPPQQPLTIAPSFADNPSNTRILSQPLPSFHPHNQVPPADTGSLPDAGSFEMSVTNDVANVSPNVYLNQARSLQLVNQSYPPLLSAPQYGEEHPLAPQPLRYNPSTLPLATHPYTNTSTPPQSAHIYPTRSDSVNHDYSIATQPHSSHHAYLPPLRNSGAEQGTAPGTQSTQPSLESEQISPTYQQSPHQQHSSHGMFHQAHNFSLTGAVFIDNNAPNFTLNMSDNNFMVLLLKETIPGAEFDSSDPNMPLRCHPGTRLQIIKRCQEFILNREGRPKLRWVVGAAGVGKSAIMQSVAQDEFGVLADIIVGATIFFSVNGRQDGTKTIMTIAYQLAVKLDSYRLFVQREVAHNPSLLRKSLSRQFSKFIVEPFIHHRLLHPSSRLLIIIDGLDECANPFTQQELLGLITDFCVTYPTSPVVWMIASRPEPHITSFFSQPKIALLYEKEEIVVDSDDAYEDVKRYFRDKFREIQMTSITLQHLPQWPPEGDFSQIAEASGGLFAYASTVIRYIRDPTYGDPVSQLDDVLNIIKTGTEPDASGQDHPMAQLDALYAHIMSKIPAKVMANTRKLLLLYVGGLARVSFHFNCNMLGMSESAAYGATHHIRSIAIVPGPAEASKQRLTFFHKSFPDYLRDSKRSGFSLDIKSEAEDLMGRCGVRILEEAPEGVAMDGRSAGGLNLGGGTFKNGPWTGDNISVSWPAVGEEGNREIRLIMFHRAVWEVMEGLRRRREHVFQSLFCIRVLTTCFIKLPRNFPIDALRDLAFDESRRRELLEYGILKQVLADTLDYDTVPRFSCIQLRFRSSAVEVSDPYELSCQHEREGKWESHNQDWSTKFVRPGGQGSLVACNHCFQRFTTHLKTRLRGRRIVILDLTPTYRLVELRFGDVEDGVPEWIYVFEYGDRWGA